MQKLQSGMSAVFPASLTCAGHRQYSDQPGVSVRRERTETSLSMLTPRLARFTGCPVSRCGQGSRNGRNWGAKRS